MTCLYLSWVSHWAFLVSNWAQHWLPLPRVQLSLLLWVWPSRSWQTFKKRSKNHSTGRQQQQQNRATCKLDNTEGSSTWQPQRLPVLSCKSQLGDSKEPIFYCRKRRFNVRYNRPSVADLQGILPKLWRWKSCPKMTKVQLLKIFWIRSIFNLGCKFTPAPDICRIWPRELAHTGAWKLAAFEAVLEAQNWLHGGHQARLWRGTPLLLCHLWVVPFVLQRSQNFHPIRHWRSSKKKNQLGNALLTASHRVCWLGSQWWSHVKQSKENLPF